MADTWKEVAFLEDVANLSSGVPEGIGTSKSAGVDENASRDDHVHDLDVGCIDSSLLFDAGVVPKSAIAADAVTSAKVLDDAIGSEHIEQLDAELDFGGQQAKDMSVMQSAAAPTGVVGKMYQDSGTQKLYVCTALGA